MTTLESLAPSSGKWAALPGGVDAFLVRGVSLKPLAVVTAGVHGDEYEGPAAVAELAGRLDGGMLAGSAILIPVVNSMAWRAAQRTSPGDGLNLARTFPGNANGSPTERLAAHVFEVARHADLLIDLHSGGVEYQFAPVAGFYGEPIAGNPSFDYARRFGLPYAWLLPPTNGVLSYECWKLGITTVGCEYHGAGQLSEAGVVAYAAGVLSCMALAGVSTTGATLAPGGRVVTGDWMPASAVGIFRARRQLGDRAAPGDLLAEIQNERGAVCQRFVAQHAGRVLGLRSKAYIRAGDWGVLIGSEA